MLAGLSNAVVDAMLTKEICGPQAQVLVLVVCAQRHMNANGTAEVICKPLVWQRCSLLQRQPNRSRHKEESAIAG